MKFGHTAKRSVLSMRASAVRGSVCSEALTRWQVKLCRRCGQSDERSTDEIEEVLDCTCSCAGLLHVRKLPGLGALSAKLPEVRAPRRCRRVDVYVLSLSYYG